MPIQKYQITVYLNEIIEKVFANASRSFNSSAYIRALIKHDLKKPEKKQLFKEFNDGTVKREYKKDKDE